MDHCVFRKATEEDIPEIVRIYDLIHTEEEAGRLRIGWSRGVYPVRQTAVDAIRRGDLFIEVCAKSQDDQEPAVVGAAIINQSQVPVYAQADWLFPAQEQEVMVLHTLVIDPACSGQGYGSAFVRFYEEYARAQGCKCLRMDTNEKNAAARRLYDKLGYREAGIVPCTFNGIPGVGLVCLEKKL